MIRFLIHAVISIITFVVLMGLIAIDNWLNKKKMTGRVVALIVGVTILANGLYVVFPNPIGDFINSEVDKLVVKAESVYVENKYISLTHYNRGYYTGYMLNDKPHGQGILVYPSENEYHYSITIGDKVYNALRYEGGFEDGWRKGKGTVYYEGGYREEGTYEGQWAPGNIVFRGKIWDGDKRYIDVIIYSQNGIESWIDSGEGWIDVK